MQTSFGCQLLKGLELELTTLDLIVKSSSSRTLSALIVVSVLIKTTNFEIITQKKIVDSPLVYLPLLLNILYLTFLADYGFVFILIPSTSPVVLCGKDCCTFRGIDVRIYCKYYVNNLLLRIFS